MTSAANTTSADTQSVKQALTAGQITVPDLSTGYHRSMYARCPSDGQAAGIRRLVREHGHEITSVTMYCSRCGNEFVAPVESIFLR